MQTNKSKMDDYIEVIKTSTDLKAAWKNFDIERLVIIREKLVWLVHSISLSAPVDKRTTLLV